MMDRDIRCDLAIVGGGLAGGLIAYAFAVRRPEVRVMLIESGRIGGNHIWSCFLDDLDEADRWLIEPFISALWSQYEVAFPGHHRTIAADYVSLRSERLDEIVRKALPQGALIAGKAITVSPTSVVLDGGQRIHAKGVIDARGPAKLGLLSLGWQKFLGQELRLAAPHRLSGPIIMDATVDQIDGFRFVYVLPFAEDRLFIEDTYYSHIAHLDQGRLALRIAEYADAQGWEPVEVLREEIGSLPIVLGGDFQAYWESGGHGAAKAGMRAALFHPTTGYSLPDAVRFAALMLAQADLAGSALHQASFAHASALWRQRGYYRMLARMLFLAAKPSERYRVLERFYTLDPALIGRFYAGRSTSWDKFRILSGKPPVPVTRALRAVLED
jgi:lycopene beta-cyclase